MYIISMHVRQSGRVVSKYGNQSSLQLFDLKQHHTRFASRTKCHSMRTQNDGRHLLYVVFFLFNMLSLPSNILILTQSLAFVPETQSK